MKHPAASPRLRVLGCGEAFDTGLGNNSCLLYDGAKAEVTRRPRVPTILFDCGYQIPERIWALPGIYPRIEGIYFTHTHADHAFGVVPLLTRFWEEGRKEPLKIIGPRGIETYVKKVLDLGYPGIRQKLPFALEFAEVKEGDSFGWGNLEFGFARSVHSVLNLSVRVEGKGELSGLSFGVSGDGQITPETRQLFADVDVLLQEVYSLESIAPVHCDLKTLSKFASESAMKRIGITHVSRSEKARVAKYCQRQLKRREPRRWFVLKPGMEIPFRLERA